MTNQMMLNLLYIQIEYEDYIERLYPQWKEQVLAKAAEKREKVCTNAADCGIHCKTY